MAVVTVKKPTQVQVEVSANTVQNVFTETDPSLRITPPSLSTTSVSLEEPGSVAVAGSLASIKNFFQGQEIDFSSGGMQLGTDTIKLFGANNTIQLGNSFISLANNGNIMLNGETAVKLQEMSDVPDILSGDGGKFLKILPDETGYTYHDIGIFHHTNNFIDLKDTPSTYGTDGQLVKINPTGNGFVYFTPSYVTQTDVNNTISSTVNKSFVDDLNVDAGTLDGLDSTTIQNYNNLTNKPFIPTATSHLTNNSGFATTASLPTKLSDLTNDEQFRSETFISQKIANTIVKSYVDNLNIDAQTLDGLDSSDLQNYNNLTNKPTIPTTTGALTNDAGFITISSVPTTLSELSNDVNFVDKTYVDTRITEVVDAAPEALNTLNELAQALGDDSNFVSTVTNQLAAKANTSSLAAVATSGKFVDLIDEPTISTVGSSGDYDDLINKPSIYTQSETFTLITNRINSVVNKGFIDALDVDSVTLGGNAGSHYLNYNNFTNKPVIPSLTSQLTNDAGFVTSVPTALSELANDVNFATVSFVNSAIQTNVTKNLIDGLLVDAGTLDGKDVTTIQDYTNLTNKPNLHAVATSGSYTDLINKPDLKTVATTGSYSDLTNIPAIYSQTQTQELIANTVNKTFIDGLLVNAGTIDGYDFTDLLNKHTSVISDLSNVVTETLPDGSILKYNLANTTWVSSTVGAVVASDVQIGDLKNVSANVNSQFANGFVLKYNTDNPSNPWFSERLKYSEILNTPENLSDFTNDSQFITISSVPVYIGDLQNVSNTTPSSGEVLKWDGNQWGPAADTGGSGGGGGGSGGDATTLDGFDSPYFLDYTNLTNKPSLSTVATTGAYSDLTGKPTYSAVATTGSYADLSGTPTNLSDFANDVNFATTSYVNTTIATIVSKSFIESLDVNVQTFNGANSAYYLNYSNLTNKPSLHAVATSGSYSDLGNRPTIPTATSELTNDAGFITSAPSALSELANDVNFATTSYVNTTISNIVTQSFVETLNPNVSTFNGQTGSYYLDYENFTNKPNISGIIGLTVTKGFVDALNIKANNTVFFDGANSEFYLEYTNFANTPYVPSTLENLSNVSNTAPTAAGQVLTWDGNKWASAINIPANNTVMNADTLDGFDSPYFLDYDNFTNTPTIDEIPGSLFGASLNLHSFASVSNTHPTNGQALVWNSTDNQWKPGTVASSGGGTVDTTGNNIILGQPTIDFGGDLLLDGASVTMKANNTVADAIDILNETILNIRDNTYVRHAEFTSSVTSDASGHTGHQHSPLTVQFTDAGDYTLSSPQHLWTFQTSSGNQTSSAQNPSFTFNENNGGTFLVTHRIYSNNVKYPGSAGSFAEHSANVVVTTPLPIPEFVADDTSIDLDGGGTTVNFTSTTQHASHFMWEFGDGTVHPTGALASDPTGTESSGVTWSSTANISHLYTGTSDTQFTVKLHAWHSSHNNFTPHATHVITKERSNYIKGYVAITPTFTSTTLQGNNQDTTDNDVAVEGHKVTFTDTTSGMGSGFGQSLSWQFSNTASDATYIKDSSGSTGYTTSGTSGGAITRYFSRDNISGPATVSYQVKLLATSGHSSSPFESSSVTVIVNKDPRSNFTFGLLNNPTGHTSYNANTIGFYYTGYDGLNYGIGRYVDTSQNVDTFKWDFNNDGTTDSTVQGPVNYTFPAAGTYSSKLIATGSTSESITDDTETKTNIFTINPAPSAPSGLTGKTIGIPSSVGTNPTLCNGATNNSTETLPSAGTSVNRQTTSDSSTLFESTELSDFTAKWPGNGTYTAEFRSFINGVINATMTLNTNDQSGSNSSSMYITADVDSNSLTPATYPLNFYRQIKGKVAKAYHSTGYNTYQIRHSDGTQTNVAGWVQDDLTDVPTCSAFTVSQSSAGTLRYMSSIPYYNTGATLSISSLSLTNITGQTYNNTSSFVTVENNSGNAISTQTYDYPNTIGQVIPSANLKTSTSIAALSVNVNGSGIGVGTLKLKAVNVNGSSAYSTDTQQIKYWKTTPSFDETNLSGPSVTMKRIAMGLSGATPSYTATNFYTNNAWNSQTSTVSGTDEAVMSSSGIVHDETNYSTFLPAGPNLSSGRSGTQYFTVAFSKPGVNNFTINITGEITSLHVALPGTATDSTSGLNGWLSAATNYFGAGTPGSLGGGNTSDGVANGATTGPISLNSNGSHTVDIKFGPVNTSSLGNQGNNILIRFGVASGKSVTAFSAS